MKTYKDQAAIELKPLKSSLIAFEKEQPNEGKSILSRKSGSKTVLSRERKSIKFQDSTIQPQANDSLKKPVENRVASSSKSPKSYDKYSPIRTKSKSKSPMNNMYSTLTPIYGRNSLIVPPAKFCEYHGSPDKGLSADVDRDFSPASRKTINLS